MSALSRLLRPTPCPRSTFSKSTLSSRGKYLYFSHPQRIGNAKLAIDIFRNHKSLVKKAEGAIFLETYLNFLTNLTSDEKTEGKLLFYIIEIFEEILQ